MEQQDLNPIMRDLRTAQRLVVAFHQRMLPIIETIGSQLNSSFYYWQPVHHNAPCRSATSPFKKWKWDFSPLHNTVFHFLSDDIPSPHQLVEGGYMLVIHLVTDTAVDDAFESTKKSWNPLDIATGPEQSRSVLRIYVYGAERDGEQQEGWWKLYANHDWPMLDTDCVEFETGGRAFGLEFDIATLGTPEAIQALIATIKDQLHSRGYAKFEQE